MLRWRVPATHKTMFQTHGNYVVARLLWEHQMTEPNPDIKFTNLCRLPQCVAPAHWQPLIPPPTLRLEQRGVGAWVLVHAATGVMLTHTAPARLRLRDNTVHTVSLTPGAPVVALCGLAIDPAAALLVEASVTCRGGC